MNNNNNKRNISHRGTTSANNSNGRQQQTQTSTPTPTSTSTPLLQEYGTRYEQLLLEQKKLNSLATKYQNRRQQLSSPNTIHDDSASSIAAAMTANRVAMLGMLQSAIHLQIDQFDNCAKNGDIDCTNNQHRNRGDGRNNHNKQNENDGAGKG